MTTKPPSPDTPESWGAASRGYADAVAPYLMRGFAEPLIERLDVGSDATVLEVGAGSGALTEALFSQVQRVVATDFAPKMIDVLRDRMEKLGASNVDYHVMDGQALDFADASFDAAAGLFVVMLYPDRARGLAELRRVVKPGGRVAVSGWAGPDRFEVFGLFLQALSRAIPDMPAAPAPPPVLSLADPAVFRAEMEAAGLQAVEIDFVARDLTVTDFDQLWLMLTAGAPPVQMMFDRIGADSKQRVRDTLRQIVEERYGSGPIVTTNVATMGSGVVA